MGSCWAAALGGCKKGSREHIVSKSLWTVETVHVGGLPWCQNEMKTIGRASLTAKALCVAHNSALSPTDTAAKAAFHALREALRLTKDADRYRTGTWQVQHFTVDGRDLER